MSTTERTKVILFLGSGVSLASGLPSVDRIMEELQRADAPPKIQQFLTLLNALDRQYLTSSAPYEASPGVYKYTGQIYRAVTTYEDLFYLASQIALNGSGLINDATADAFTELTRKKGANFLTSRTKTGRLIELTKLASQTTRFIEQKVASVLYTNTVRQLDLIAELAISDLVDQLCVITLNHDTLVEQLFRDNHICYADGFGLPDGDLRWFEDMFPDNAKVWLVKLHGSISWHKAGDVKVVQPAAVLKRIEGCKNGREEYLRWISPIPSFLSGQSKVALYHRGIFADMHYRFQQALRRSKLIIMSGYGWGDTPLNFHLEYWLDRDVNNKLILLYEKPEELANRSNEMAQMYGAYTRSGRIVAIRRWLADTCIEELEDYIRNAAR